MKRFADCLSRLRELILPAACLCLSGALSCSDGDQAVPVLGTAVVAGAPAGARFLVEAQTLDGEPVGQIASDGTGGFDLDMEVPSGTSRVLLTAVLPENPDRRTFLILDLEDSAVSSALTHVAGAAEGPSSVPSCTPAGCQGVALDTRTSAKALVMAAAGDLNAPLAQVEQKYGPQIDSVAADLASFDFPLCSVDTSQLTGQNAQHLGSTLREVTDISQLTTVPKLVQELKELEDEFEDTGLRLKAIQESISNHVWSINNPRLKLYIDSAVGFIPTVLLRIALWAHANEGINEIIYSPISQADLGKMAVMIAGVGWGNCREKAYLSALFSSLVPGVKQVAIVGVLLPNDRTHAVAVACLDGPEVFDLSKYGGPFGTDLVPPPEATCYVVDAWEGPPTDPSAGHTEILDDDYHWRHDWQEIDGVRTVIMNTSSPLTAGLSTGGSGFVDCGVDGKSCTSFTLPEEPQPPKPDAGIQEDTFTCPAYPPDGKSCGASLDGCIEGFYCSTETIACEQESCPPGSGRTYTLECCCNCWDDKSLVNVYDPCRAGFLLRCDPAP